MAKYVSVENQIKIVEMSMKIDKYHSDYLDKVSKIGEKDTEMKKGHVNQFFGYTNNFRNLSRKELNKKDSILMKDIKLHPAYKDKDFKDMITKDYPDVNKAVFDHEKFSVNKLSEILKDENKKKDDNKKN